MNWLNKLSFRSKMAIPNMVILTFFLIILAFIYRTFNYQIAINEQIQKQIQPVLNNFDDGYRDMYQMIAAAQAVMLANGDASVIKEQAKEYEDNAPKVIPRITSAETLISENIISAKLQNDLSELTTAFNQWRKHYDQVFVSPEHATTYISANKEKMDALFSIVRKRLKNIRKAIEAKQASLLIEENKAVKEAYWVMMTGAIISIFTSVILSFLFSNAILKPLRKLKMAMAKIATGDGDLRQRISIDSDDEIGELGQIFNQFADKIQHLVKEVIVSANALKEAIAVIDESTQSIAASTTEASTENTSIAASVHEFSTTSEQVKCDANEAADASNLASQDAKKVKQSLDSTVNAIDTLGEDIEQASNVITELEAEVSNIVSILDVIRGIADQTNLLALNAAIEAARAGEQGRGFAVVADEVRSLASKTQESTGEIQSMIEKLQLGTKSAVEVMLQSNETSQKTTEQAIIANSSLSAITESINVIMQMNNQIAQAASEQSQVSESINATIQALANKGTDLVSMVSDASTKCHLLGSESERLEYLVQQFKV